MTIEVRLVRSRIDAAPGDVVEVPIQLTNTADTPTTCRMTVVGLGAPADAPDTAGMADVATGMASGVPGIVVVPPKSTVEVATPVAVPSALGIGDHAAAVEISSDRPGSRPSLTPFVIAIGSVARVELVAVPSTIRGRRRAKFKLDVINHEPADVQLAVSATAPDVEVEFATSELHLAPGERVLDAAKIKGPRHWSGEPTQHNLVITARGRSGATSTTTAAYVQRPLFAHRARAAVAAIAVIALWLGAIGGVALWWSNRQDDDLADESSEVVGVDTNGDGVPDQFTLPDGTVITGVDTDGDRVPDQFFDEAGNPVPDPTGGAGGSGGSDDDGSGDGGSGGDDDDGPTGPTSAVLRGTVKADGDLSNITITLQPMAPGAAAPADVQGFAGPARPEAAKVWSARMVPVDSTTLNPVRQTQPLAPVVVNPKADGVWQIPDVALRQSYTVVFAKPGYQTQSFVVTPPDDGSAVDLDVELVPGKGSLQGRVTGPNGPLGGAAITVSNGTLTFTTTAATVGEVGTWAVDQVSTPGVYTVTATLRGYGTEVRQVTLTPEQPDAVADLTLRSGVGSISGRIIGPDGQPIGGAAVTATDGDVSRTTSSLTEGDIGSYTIPQLTQSVDYTLTVEAPGYVTQSRRTPVNGAVAGVDFTMSKTTIQLTGIVTSGPTGVGIANAGLILKTGDLQFRAATVGGENRGRFAIDDLPPGEYTITVEHYQHVTSTQSITLTAGVTPPPLEIALERSSGLPPPPNGSLVIEVVDPAGEDADTREINNATVTLVRTLTGEVVRTLTQEPYNFRLDEIPIGTYTVLVTAPRYNPAPPRQVSLGASETRIEVQMMRLGQASGFVIDSISKARLNDYSVNVYRQPESPGDSPIFVLRSNSSGLWQTPPDSLTPGTYRVEITDAGSTPGYLVRNDQLLDPSVVGAGDERNMRFLVPEGVVDPISVGDIQADAYPTITGRVYRPTMPPDSIGYNAVDSADLAVAMSCGGGSVAASVSDDAGTTGATPPLFDSFTITKEQIDAGNLTGTCTLGVSPGAGLADQSVELLNVEANDGVTSTDRRLHIVVAPPAPQIGGRVFWRDGSKPPIPIAGATVSSTRTIGFNTVTDPALAATPTTKDVPFSTTSTSAGEWQLDGQVYGVAPYVFSAPNFADGSINVRVDDTGASASAGANAAVNEAPDGKFEVELSSPAPRTLTGNITIQSTTPDFSAIAITATSPTGGAITENTADPVHIVRGTPVGTVLPFTIANASPGTWRVNVAALPAHHQFDTTPVPVEQFVDVGPTATPVPGFDISMRELAELELTLVDGNGVAITTPPTITLSPVGGGPTLSGPMTPTSPGSNTFEFTDILVAAANPATVARDYTFALGLTGYDMRSFQAVPVAFFAGQTVSRPLTVPRYGSITGTVEGLRATADYESITLCDPNAAAPIYAACTDGKLAVVSTDSTGVPIVGAPAPTLTVTGNQYTIVGAPGYYSITVTHPQYQPQTAPGSVVPSDNFAVAPPADTPPAGVNGVFRLVNDRANTPSRFELQIIRGTLSMSTVLTLAAPATPVTTATYILTRTGEPTLTGPVTGGSIAVADLYPGTYQLQLREYATPQVPASGEVAFPVITTVNVERAVAGVASTTTVRAPLPPLSPTVSGTIEGQNQAGQLVPLPAGATFGVTSTFDEPAVEINGTATVPNPTQGDATATMDASNRAGGVVAYQFARVPAGSHNVILAITPSNAMTGYTLTPAGSLTKTLVVTGSGALDGPDYVFKVENVTVRVTLSAGDYPGMTGMKLRSPSGVEYLGTFDAPTDTITFVGVGPEIGEFDVEFQDQLHQPHTATDPGISVPVDLAAPYEVTASVSTTPSVGRLTGSSTMRNTTTETVPLGVGATITFTGGSAGASCLAPTPCVITAAAPLPNYTIDLNPGQYDIVTQLAGYTRQTLDNVNVVGGRLNPGTDVQIVKQASIKVTLTNSPVPTGTTVSLYDVTAGTPATTLSPTGNSVTFSNLTPTPNRYRVVVGAPGYGSQTFPAADDYYTLPIGEVFPPAGQTSHPLATVTLAPRTVTVNVTGAPTTGTTVTAKFGAVTRTLTSAPYVFSSATWPEMPLSGSGIVVVDAGAAYRAVKADIVGASPAETVPVTLSPLASVTGTIGLPPGLTSIPAGTNVVTATASGMPSQTVDVTAGATGSYTVTGLDVGTDSSGNPVPLTWTVTYDAFGVGIGSTSVVVGSNSVTPATPANITPVPQNVPVTFRVTATQVAGDVTVTFNGQNRTVTPSAAGTVTSPVINIPETATGLAWTLTGAGYQSPLPTGSVTPTSRTAIEVPVTVVRRPITGVVMTSGGSPSAVVGATVRICPATPVGTMCTSPAAGSDVLSVAGGAYTIPDVIPAGSYRVWAVTPGGPPVDDGSVTLTVNANGTFTLGNSTITVN